MSRPLKKPRAVFPLEEYVPDEEEDLQDEMIGQTINVDFDAFKAENGDFHGIKQLLQQTFRGLELNISGIADIVISQNYVGSVVKQVVDEDYDDDDEVEHMDDNDQIFGVSTILNLTSRKDEEPIAKLRSALVEKCHQFGLDSTNTLVRESLGNESTHVGFLLSERLVNLPAQFALPVYESLLKELKDAKKSGHSFDFTYLVMISKCYKEKKKKNKNSGETESEVMWSNPEEEIFSEECLASFEYPVKGDTALSGDWEEDDLQYTPWRRVLILEAKKLPDIIGKIRQAIS